MWRRTTLVRTGGKWSLVEFGEDISRMDDRETVLENPETVEQVITLAHNKHCSPAELCFEVTFDDDAPLQALKDEAPAMPAVEVEQPPAAEPGGEADTDAAEVAVRDPVEWHPDELGANELEIEGVKISVDSSLNTLRAGCRALGLPTGGNKRQCFRRMAEFVRTQDLIAAEQVRQDQVRVANEAPIPRKPTQEEVRVHVLTHTPYQPWCSLCVTHRGRQDAHRAETHEGASQSVVSIDFGFSHCNRAADQDGASNSNAQQGW